MFRYFLQQKGDGGCSGEPHGFVTRFFAMYHHNTTEHIETLYMGVDFPNVRRVLQYALLTDMEQYVQQIGLCKVI